MPHKAEESADVRGAVRGYRPIQPGTQPEYFHPAYASSELRSPRMPLINIPPTLTEVTGPQFQASEIDATASDLTRQHKGEPIGERIIVSGQVRDENGRPVPHTLVEVWQANAAGRYLHEWDQHPAPLDPNFSGTGAAFTDADGYYRFVTIRPGSYPWRNHYNAWRPAHIHFSLFGPAFATRLVTQMYFPGDPLLAADPIYNCVSDEKAKQRLIAGFDWETTIPEIALGYRFDVVLRGREETPMETDRHLVATTSQTVGPFFKIGLAPRYRSEIADAVPGDRITIEGRVLDGKGVPVPDACLEIWQADASGNYAHAKGPDENRGNAFEGYGRVPTDEAGRFRFTTIKPGTDGGQSDMVQAPHLAIGILMRGLLRRLTTRMYFPGEPTNARDPVLGFVEASRRATLVARKSEEPGLLFWDVRLQGDQETVFLNC